jgi:hypothetical protein
MSEFDFDPSELTEFAEKLMGLRCSECATEWQGWGTKAPSKCPHCGASERVSEAINASTMLTTAGIHVEYTLDNIEDIDVGVEQFNSEEEHHRDLVELEKNRRRTEKGRP